MKAQSQHSKPGDFTQWLQQYAEHLRGLCSGPQNLQTAPATKPKR
jgi:hypothetical protein